MSHCGQWDQWGGHVSWPCWYFPAIAGFGERSLCQRAGVDGYSRRVELWRFRWDRVWLEPELALYQTNCQVATSLFFSEANCWVSLAKFSKSSFGEMSIWSLVRLLLGRLRAALPADVSAEGWLLGSRARCRMSGTLVIAEASGEVPATFAFISGGSQAAMALTQLREGVAALRVVARGVSWGMRLRAVAAEAWVSPLQRSTCSCHLLEQSGTTGSPHCPEKCPAALQEPGGDPSVFIGREEHHRKREGLRSQVTTLRGRCEEWSVQGGVGAALAGVWA